MGEDIKRQQLFYRYFAYRVIRDALGFYLGIPTFLSSSEATYKDAFETLLTKKTERYISVKGKPPGDAQIKAFSKSIKKKLAKRLSSIEEDYKECELILLENNIWLDLLGLDEDFFPRFICRLSGESVEELSVVPNWLTPDISLGRSYINDNFATSINFPDA